MQKPSFSESTSENHVSFRGQHLRDIRREERAIAPACVCGNLGSVPHVLDPDNPLPPPCSGCDPYQTTLGRCPCELGTALRGPSGHPDFHRKEERSEMIRQRPHGGGLGLGWDLVPRLSYEGFTASISPATGSVGCGRGDGMPVSAFRFPQTGCASHPVSVHRWREPHLDSKKLTLISKKETLQCLPEIPAGGGRPPCIHGPRSQPSGGLSVTSAPIWNLLPAEAPSAAISFLLFLSEVERLPLHSGHSSRPQFPFQGRNAAHISRARASGAGLGRGGGGGEGAVLPHHRCWDAGVSGLPPRLTSDPHWTRHPQQREEGWL